MISFVQIGETPSRTPAEQSSPTPTQASTTGERKSESTKQSRTKSSGSRRRKKKRETPKDLISGQKLIRNIIKYLNIIRDLQLSSVQKCDEIFALLRDSKATRKQCSFTRQKTGIWKSLKLRWAYHPTHSTKVSAYKKALKEVVPLGKTENLDIDF